MALVVLSIVLLPSIAAAQGEATYPDVAADAYYAVAVQTLGADGVFDGTLCEDGFCPDEPIDRKTMAVWTVRVIDGQDPPAVSRSRFDDVDAMGFHARFIERMAKLDMTQGCGDGNSFCPDRTVTRAEMAAFLSRAFNLPDGPGPKFADVPSNVWYAADVAKLTASRVTVGCKDGTVFCPSRDTTRGQMASFLHRAATRPERDAALQRAALVALYNATDGPGWRNPTNWVSDRPLEDWFGVSTDRDGMVTHLGLSRNGLSGQIPAELSNLIHLEELFLDGNQLSGHIPSGLSTLTNLAWLHLGRNQLSGEIPSELSAMANLEYLNVSSNRLLSGRVPDSFTALDNLDDLRLEGTDVCVPTDESFQAWLEGVGSKRGAVDCASDSRDWAPLVALYNATDGPNWGDRTNWLTNRPLGDWLGVSTDTDGRVTRLTLSGNELDGTIPSELSTLTNLTSLDLGNNELSGEIPSELSALTDLRELYLSDNELSGQIPSGLSVLAALTRLELGGNELGGEIPSELSALSDLTYLDLSDNPSLSGPLPGLFTGLTSLDELNLDGTGLCAPTDSTFQSWLEDITRKEGVVDCGSESPARAALVALYNAADGPIWDDKTNWLSSRPLGYWFGVSTGNDGRVTHLGLAGNGLNGAIPSGLSALGDLTYLDLSDNPSLSGPLPGSFTALSSLEELYVDGTGLCAPVDATFQAWLQGITETEGVVNCSASPAA